MLFYINNIVYPTIEGFRTFLRAFISSGKVFVCYKLRVNVAVAIFIQLTGDLL